MAKTSLALAGALALVGTAAPAAAAPLATLANLNSLTVYEITYATLGTVYAPGSAALMSRIAQPLDAAHYDISYFPGEYYDLFYSNADGTFNANGGYLTIEGSWRAGGLTPFGGMNINEVFLNFGGSSPANVHADMVTHFVMGSTCVPTFGANCIIGSQALAIDGNLATFPRFGQTSDTNLAERFSLTLGFSPYSLAGVPEASTWAMMILGMGAIGAASRRRPARVRFTA